MKKKVVYIKCFSLNILLCRTRTQEATWYGDDWSAPTSSLAYLKGCPQCQQITSLCSKLQGSRGLPDFAKVSDAGTDKLKYEAFDARRQQ